MRDQAPPVLPGLARSHSGKSKKKHIKNHAVATKYVSRITSVGYDYDNKNIRDKPTHSDAILESIWLSMNGFLSDCPGELPPGRGYLHNLPRIGAHPTAAIHLETRMDETDPQDRVQAAKEHLKEAADDLHSATKGGVHGFGCWSSLESQVVEISGYRDIRVGTLARLSYAQPRWF